MPLAGNMSIVSAIVEQVPDKILAATIHQRSELADGFIFRTANAKVIENIRP